jgi:ferredoxin
MKLHIDLDECCGHGRCEEAAPGLFEVGDDGLVHLRVDELSEADRPLLVEAVRVCPARALSLED